ncbi:hydroxymethylpyrimidine/phosphomethylpyrimidine kinase / thiaminase, partial [Geosmithia morbida]
GCYAMTATTALTAQNTRGVHDIFPIPTSFVRRQIESCVEDIGVDVVKTGMLASAETIEMVMVSTSGTTLLPNEATEELIKHLLPLTTILTPNVPEAKLIAIQAGVSPPGPGQLRSVADLETLARTIQSLGPRWVLLKGGHLPLRKGDLTAVVEGDGDDDEKEKVVVDVLVGPGDADVVRVQSPWQKTTSTHGTGCSLASAIACGLSNGLEMTDAVRSACRYVEAGIKTAPGLGGGNGPLNHFHSLYILPFAPSGYFVEYLLSRADVKDVWRQFVHHPFVMAMGDGSLPIQSFKGYIVQDYLYLIHFSRANALAAYKAKNMRDIARSAAIVAHIMTETSLHLNYCQSFGMTIDEIRSTEELQACTAYTRFVLDVGQSEDWLALQVAMAPCLLGYYAVADMLRSHADTVRDDTNTYWTWIKNYVADDYVEAVRLGSDLLEKYAMKQSPARIEELVKIFIHGTRMEIGFWEMFPSK